MIEANMHEAKTKLSQLVEAVERGEQVFLKRGGVRVAEIIRLPLTALPFGILKDQVGSIPDELFFANPAEEIEEFTRL